jgi:uncharacterized membrane protein (Fun14 family)
MNRYLRVSMPRFLDVHSMKGHSIGGGFLAGALVGYALKQAIKIAAIIVGLFIAALAYLEYQRIVFVDWEKLQRIWQIGITWLANAVIHISNSIGSDHGPAQAYGSSYDRARRWLGRMVFHLKTPSIYRSNPDVSISTPTTARIPNDGSI